MFRISVCVCAFFLLPDVTVAQPPPQGPGNRLKGVASPFVLSIKSVTPVDLKGRSFPVESDTELAVQYEISSTGPAVGKFANDTKASVCLVPEGPSTQCVVPLGQYNTFLPPLKVGQNYSGKVIVRAQSAGVESPIHLQLCPTDGGCDSQVLGQVSRVLKSWSPDRRKETPSTSPCGLDS
jgi:hypothetical protein